MGCEYCGSKEIAKNIGICASCIRERKGDIIPKVMKFHDSVIERYFPGATRKGRFRCVLCSNNCSIDSTGRCGVIRVVDGRLRVPTEYGFLDYYFDPLPTNCCNAWFCAGCTGAGYPKYALKDKCEYGYYNLAVFFYGCNFNCFYCQNYTHKNISRAPTVSIDELVNVACDQRVSCVCYFGGSPEPHMVYALNVSRKILERSREKSKISRICWEWNGCGNPNLVLRAAEISLVSGGTIKFDLKAWSREMSFALSGVDNTQAYANFRAIFEKYYEQRPEIPLLSATTLLVPYYVDEYEVEGIARFISSLSPEIPYSLLAFYPTHYASDLMTTRRKHAEVCYNIARRYLKNVYIGNVWLLR